MSAVRQKMRLANAKKTKMETGNWSKMFPSKVDTNKMSLAFTKKLLAVSVSNITYLRSMFPEEAYADRSMDGIQLKILKENNKSQAAGTLAGWLVGVFEALEKRYLREMMLIVLENPNQPEKVHEMYTYRFSYPDGNVSCQMLQGEGQKEVQKVQPDSVYSSTVSLLRSIIMTTQTLEPLPTSSFLSMKLTYYDDETPMEYEPNGFVPTDKIDFTFPADAVSFGLGKVSTDHHALSVHLNGFEHSVASSQKSGASVISNRYSSKESETEQQESSCVGDGKAEEMQSETTVCCTCKNATKDDFMLACNYCQKEQHAACYRITRQSQVPEVHCCVVCSNEDSSRVCTDPKLVKMSANPAIVVTCLFRRVLVCLTEVESVNKEFFNAKFDVEDHVSEGIVQKLLKDDIARKDGETYFINQNVLESKAIPKYLGFKKQESAVNTLLKKTSQMFIGNHGDKVRKSGGSKRSLVSDEFRAEPSKKKGKMSRSKKEFAV